MGNRARLRRMGAQAQNIGMTSTDLLPAAHCTAVKLFFFLSCADAAHRGRRRGEDKLRHMFMWGDFFFFFLHSIEDRKRALSRGRGSRIDREGIIDMTGMVSWVTGMAAYTHVSYVIYTL
ncbi:hypothetical protein BC939DRAFT_26840 [Gamsiella multidivaricata]|uniref:uncharacterized protein n=1 Tax=Gamsiella multidivaricata TaxID=101098 RepID=UPI002220FEF9|nr:uncharacterized protein BC939DRAFT_26840 [Gamsiella multidivaricata]KAI7829443.1 hypothetical protein BC939DRAFT_26840 [Gamsiella multidivaricata]